MASGPSGPSPSCTNKDAADAGIGDPTPTNTNVDTNVGSCGTPNATEDDGTTLTLGKTRKFISDVWEHFTLEVRDGIDKAICIYCKKALGGSSKNGTKHLRDHQRCCPMKKYRNIAQDFAQKKLKLETSGDQKGKLGYGNLVYDEEEVRRELCNMVIMHEYPLAMVNHLGFRRYSKALNPTFKMISRNTLKKDIIKIFEYEKSKTMKLLGSIKSKVAITTDMWTAQNQKRGFMVITAHWVDNSWALQSRILRFAYVPCPHTAEAISEKLMECFSDWNLGRKLSSLTVDNCASNDAVIAILKDQLDVRALPLEGKFFHMRCCAHILNLIVKDGLEVIESSIEKIRDSVAYWRATPKREEIFQQVCDSLSISYSKKLKLDCKTRWNSMFLMLQTALMYREVFPKLARREKNYKCLPNDDEWDKAREFCDKLDVFYEVTLLFSGTKFPTANIYFPKVFDVRMALDDMLFDSNVTIKSMGRKMLDKWEKYWDTIHGIMGVACVLDPRYKLEMLKCCYSMIYDFDVEIKVDGIKDIIYALFNEYQEKFKGMNESHSVYSDSTNASTMTSEGSGCGGRRRTVEHIYNTKFKKGPPIQQKSELDLYLEEPTAAGVDTFDILAYWKGCESRYPILAAIAKDIYAIPVSTVASESAFSTGGRFVSPYRNRLHPKTLEALMCARDWIWASIESEDVGEVTSYRHTPSADYDDGEIEDEPEI